MNLIHPQAVALAAALALCSPSVRAAAASLRSATIALSADGSRLFTINPDSNSVSVIDAVARTKVTEVPVCGVPQTLSIDEDRLYVACRDGVLDEVGLTSLAVMRSTAVGTGPFGIVAAGGRIYVAVGGESRIAVIDSATFVPLASVATEEFPRGLAINSGILYVTHFRSGKLSAIDLASNSVRAVVTTGIDSNISQSVIIRDTRAYLPQTRSNATNPGLLFDSTAFPIVSVIDLSATQNLPKERIAIDIVDRPSSIPIDAAITSSGRILVVNAGSDDVSVIDLATARTLAHLQLGRNPRGIALSPDEHFAYVNNTLSGTVSIIDVTAAAVMATIPVTTIPLDPHILNGKILFNTSNRTSLAKDRWISCATCHFDGGTDGRTWIFRDGPRNTPSLFGVGDTIPIHWSGDLDELQDVENTIRVIQAGTGLAPGPSNCEPACDQGPPNAGRSDDLDDLAAFMRSLRPDPRSIPATPAATHGQALFFDSRTGCASCHPPPLYTDRQKHDVGTGTGPAEHKGSRFDTPSLRGLTDTAPYFHDGSAPALVDVIRGAAGQHGDTSTLSEAEKNDLAEFLRSIPFQSPRRRAVKQ